MNAAARTVELELRRRKGTLARAVVLATASAVLAIPTMIVVHQILASAIPNRDLRIALGLCAAAIVLRLVSTLTAYAQKRASAAIARDVGRHLRLTLVTAIMQSDPDAWIDHDHRRASARLVHSTERVDIMLYRVLSAIVPAAAGGLIIGAGLAWLSWHLALLCLALSPISIIAHRLAQRPAAASTAEFQESFEDFARDTAFLLSHQPLTRHRGVEELELVRMGTSIGTLASRSITMTNGFARIAAAQSFATSLIALLLAGFGCVLVINEVEAAATVVTFYVGAVLLAGSVNQAAGAIPEIILGFESLRLLSEPQFGAATVDQQTGDACETVLPLTLSGVDVGFGDQPIISGIDLTIDVGSSLVVRGANGSGKTTLLETMLGLRQRQAGTLTVAGKQLDDLDASSLRRLVGYVAQRPLLFHGTIAENVRYGRPTASADELHRALDVVRATEWIADLPSGIDTVIGDGGNRVSGGQAQQLAIARGLVGTPELLVLDEPGNHLAPGLLTDIHQRIRASYPDLAIVVVTHGNEGAVDADTETLVVDGGTLASPATGRRG